MQTRDTRQGVPVPLPARVRALVRTRMPQGLLARIRTTFLLFALFNVVLLVPAILVAETSPETLVGLASAVALGLLWVRALRRGDLDMPSRVVEPVLVTGLAWGAVEAGAVLGAYYVGLYFGALYGSRTATLTRGAAYFLAIAVALVIDGGATTVGTPEVWAHAWGAVLSSYVMWLLANAARSQEASEAAKDEFLSVVSHELRTPLTSLLGLLHTLEQHDDHLDPDLRRHLVSRARVNAERQRQLVDDLLDVSRATRGTLLPEPTAVHVGSLAKEVTEALDVTSATRVQVPDGHVAHVDRGHLHQILSNLLSNAGKYGDPPIDISSTLVAEGGTVALEVRDHGSGVSPHFLPALFERFSQESTGDRRTASGVGLGLWIARELARANGGDLQYADASPGARFTVLLPHSDGPT